MRIGTAWCVFFKRGFVANIGIRPLRHAYRGPAHFAGEMMVTGHDLAFTSCDEVWEVDDFNGVRATRHDDVDLLYVATHGVQKGTGYEALLQLNDWQPGATGLGGSRLSVVVFETCYLLDRGSYPAWQSPWSHLGGSVRLLLGFEGKAAMDRHATLRGRAFAENLINGDTFADAWLNAVKATSGMLHKHAVAIGIGDSASDAKHVLATASLNNLPPARSGAIPYFEVLP